MDFDFIIDETKIIVCFRDSGSAGLVIDLREGRVVN